MVQGSPATAICHVHVAQLGQQGLCAARGTVGSSHMQRRLPELVTCICVSSAPQQQTHCPLGRGKQSPQLKVHITSAASHI